jgi:hypothetical protein
VELNRGDVHVPRNTQLSRRAHSNGCSNDKEDVIRLYPTKPFTRTQLEGSGERHYKDRVYAVNPYDNTTGDVRYSPGRIDFGLYAMVPGIDRYIAKNVILIIEVKPADIEKGVTPGKARDVDGQLRRRTNVADANYVINRHPYLIGWIGCWFQPYYWFQDEVVLEKGAFDPNRSSGLMRPSKRFSTTCPLTPTTQQQRLLRVG